MNGQWTIEVIPLLCHNLKKLVGLYLGILFLALLCIIPCMGQEAEIESVIPAYSVAYVAVEDVPGIWDTIQASSSWMSVLSFLELTSETQDLMGEAEKFLGVDLRTLVSVFGSRVALVQVYMDMDGLTPPAIIADVGDSEDTAEMIRKMEQVVGSNEKCEVRSPAGKYQTVPFSSVKRVGEEATLRYAFLDNLFVMAFDQDTFEAILDVYLGEDPPLTYDPRFNKTRSGISADGQAFIYVNMELLWPIAWSIWDSDFGMLLRMLGVNEIKSIAWTTSLLGPTRSQEAYFYTGDGSGLITSIFAEHESLFSAHVIPASNADIFLAANVGDPTLTWDRFGDAVRELMGEDAHAQMQSELAEFERDTALSLRGDLIASLSGEIGLAMPASGIVSFGSGMEQLMDEGLVFFFGVKDREQCSMSIERILAAGGQPQATEYKEVKIYHIADPDGLAGYAFIGDLLVFGSVQTLESIIDEAAPLVVSEKFARINSQLPQRLGLMYYIDLERLGQLFLGAKADIQPVDDVMSLQTLGSTGGTLVYDGNGLKIKTVGIPSGNWLEAMGILAELFVYTLR